MTDADRCLICGAVIPEKAQVCKSCARQFHVGDGEEAEIQEEMRDIVGVLSITANVDGNIKRSTESILRIADRLKRKSNEERNRAKVFAKSSIGETENSDHNG